MRGGVGWAGWVGWGGPGGMGRENCQPGYDSITRSRAGSSGGLVLLVEARRFDVRAYRLNMGDFPRWLDREDVDSAAMYSAYLKYEFQMRKEYFKNTGAYRPVWDGHLVMIMHKLPDIGRPCQAPNVPGVRKVNCQKRPCARCDGGRGGYQFRWYCPYWGKFYNDLRRPNSWEAPGGEPPSASQSLRFWELKP